MLNMTVYCIFNLYINHHLSVHIHKTRFFKYFLDGQTNSLAEYCFNFSRKSFVTSNNQLHFHCYLANIPNLFYFFHLSLSIRNSQCRIAITQ